MAPALQAWLTDHKEAVAAVMAAGAALVGVRLVYKVTVSRRVRREERLASAKDLPEGAVEVAIVGAGPSGSCAAYYLSKSGISVALLEKEHFPRDKYCANAVCGPGIDILNEMGVMKELIAAKEVHFADKGGIVSPAGHVYVGASLDILGKPSTAAVKRLHLDARVATAAKQAGAHLQEGFEVAEATFADDLWTVTSTEGKAVKARVLVCADGATSKLAMKLGICQEPPEGICSRAFVKPGTHNVDFDGVIFYHRKSLPGYSAIFRHPHDELVFTYYLIPCGKPGMCGDVKMATELRGLHEGAIAGDPHVASALGPRAELERMKAAALRVGGQGLAATFARQLLVVGDAAGHTDPLTGEGIHNALMGGKLAAQTIIAAKQKGDYSAAMLASFQTAWKRSYGHDFAWSSWAARLIYRYPLLIDATTRAFQQNGDKLLSQWGEVMTCNRSKTFLLRPDVALPLGWALLCELWHQKVLGSKPSGQS